MRLAVRYAILLCSFICVACCTREIPDDAQLLSEFQSFALLDREGGRYEAFEITDGRVCVMVPQETDLQWMRAEFTHDGQHVLIGKREQESGTTYVDFSVSSEPVIYNVVSETGFDNHYCVYAFDLPVVMIETPEGRRIEDKENWIEGSRITIIDSDGSVSLDATMSVKGRGNTTWTYPKKPYTIKLDQKSKILGMPSDKRWNFLANWADRTLMRNTVAFAISAKTKSLEWTPRGRHVEMFLNGEYMGNYFLCEHIKIGKNRVPIREMDTLHDLDGDNLTGGYLIEIDSHYDEPLKFRTPYRNLPVNLKSPDENVRDVQFRYIMDYINELEAMLVDNDRLSVREYANFLDVDTFIDYFLVHELAEYSGPADDVYSSHAYKDCLGKLKAGPVWDFDRTTFKPGVTGFLNAEKALWYEYLFNDPVFVARLKEKWTESKPDFESVILEIEEIASEIRRSARYTLKLWPTTSRDNGDETMSFDSAVERMKQAYSSRLVVLDGLISSL